VQPEQAIPSCRNCRHARPTRHGTLVTCGMGRQAPGASGLWRGSDPRSCREFERTNQTPPGAGSELRIDHNSFAKDDHSGRNSLHTR
jgi:hypothetical protein